MFIRRKERIALQERVKLLEEKVGELNKRTVSEKTMQSEQPITYKQMVDEWLNGKENGDE
jgi:hypothetical protein